MIRESVSKESQITTGGLLLFAVLLIAALGSTGCDRRMKNAIGDHNDLVIISDEVNWSLYGETLTQIFEREVQTPRTELIFRVRHVVPDKWAFFSRWYNLLICAPLSEDTPTGDRIRAMLSADAQRRIAEDMRALTIIRDDPYAVGQRLVIITADTGERLRDYLDTTGEYIFSTMEEHLNMMVSARIYREDEQFALEDSLLTDYGFTVRVPWGFRMNRDFEEESFVRMIKYNVERWFFAYWIEGEDLEARGLNWITSLNDVGKRIEEGEIINQDLVDLLGVQTINLRDDICRKYYDRDYILREHSTATLVEFKGRWAVRIYGRWQNDEKAVGGPMVSYCFFDPYTRRLWWLDGAVFAPNQPKEPQIRQMDVMIHTFMTGEEARSYIGSIEEHFGGRK